jgi:hypothetical protein
MARLTDPNGSVVNVADDFAERLVASFGYKPAEEPAKKTTAKKATSSKTND